MKDHFTKVFSIILTLVIVITAFSGCVKQETAESQAGSQEAQSTESSTLKTGSLISEKPITLTYWCAMDANTAAVLSNYSEMEMYKEMEKLSNIKIVFKHPPVGQEKEQFNLVIASRDLPDLIEYGWISYPGGPEKAISDNIIIKLNDLIDKYAPNLKAILVSDENVNRQARTDNSVLYAFPAIGTGHVKTTGGPLMRKDWLDKLRLKAPETIDEWTNVLAQFKEKLGAEAPITGVASNFSGLDWFSGVFGVGCKYYLDNGKVKFGPIEPSFKQYVELLRNWYREGLLDQDFSANNSKAIEARVTSGQSGALFGYLGGGIGTYMNTMKDKDPNFNLIAIQYPVLNNGEEPYFLQRAWEVRTTGMLAITTANKYPVESTKWADYFYGEEGNLLKNFGIAGLTYELVNGYPKYTDLIMKNPKGLSVAHALGKYMRASSPSPGLIDSRYHEQYFALPQQQEGLVLWAKYSDNALKVTLPQITPTKEETEEVATIMANVNSYYEEMFVKFVMGVEPMEKYDEFVEQMKKMNVERVIEIYQAALDRYNNR